MRAYAKHYEMVMEACAAVTLVLIIMEVVRNGQQ